MVQSFLAEFWEAGVLEFGAMVMNKQKRVFLALMASLTAGTIAELFTTRTWAQSRTPTLPPQPEGSQNSPGAPFPSPNIDPRTNPKDILKQNDSQIHDTVEKLYFLAADLKAEVEKTNSQNVLSLVMVQKCEQIEKFAKQIKNLAKG
jgi:hypothetical protein